MDETLPGLVILSIARQAMAVADTLAPVGVTMAGSFTALGIMMLGASVTLGLGMLAPIIEVTMWAAGALFLCQNWGEAIALCLRTSNEALALFGIDGPASLFTSAAAVADRLAAESLGWGLSIDGTAGAILRGTVLAITIPIVVIALCIPGLLALLAQVTLVVGAAAAPLILGGLAWSVTRPLAWGVINFMIAATLKIIVLGLVSVIFARALTEQLALPGTDTALTMAGLAGLLLTALLAAIAGFSASSLSNLLVGYGVGGLGLHSLAQPVAVAGAASTAAGAAMAAGGSAVAAGGAAAGRAAGRISRSSGGSAF